MSATANAATGGARGDTRQKGRSTGREASIDRGRGLDIHPRGSLEFRSYSSPKGFLVRAPVALSGTRPAGPKIEVAALDLQSLRAADCQVR